MHSAFFFYTTLCSIRTISHHVESLIIAGNCVTRPWLPVGKLPPPPWPSTRREVRCTGGRGELVSRAGHLIEHQHQEGLNWAPWRGTAARSACSTATLFPSFAVRVFWPSVSWRVDLGAVDRNKIDQTNMVAYYALETRGRRSAYETCAPPIAAPRPHGCACRCLLTE